MEKEKILAWLDKLVELDEETHRYEFFDPKDAYSSPSVCYCNNKGEIHLYKAVQAICDVCGFEMDRETISHDDRSEKISFMYKGCRFFECIYGDGNV